MQKRRSVGTTHARVGALIAERPLVDPGAAAAALSRHSGSRLGLDRFARELADARDESTVWRALFHLVRNATPADSILVARYDPARQERACVYFADEHGENDIAALPPMPLHEGPQSVAIRTGDTVVTDSLSTALKGLPQVHVGIAGARRLTTSSLAVPMRASGAIIGVVELQSYQPAAFSRRDAAFVKLVAAMVGLAWESVRSPSSAGRCASLRVTRKRVARIIAGQAFAPVYQPIVDLAANEVVGYEALTRFADGVAPDEQFAAAEDCGLGLELEAATLNAALNAARALPRHAWLSLNVSPRLVLGVEPLRSLVASQARRIVLEITEHAAIADYALLRHALRRLPTRVDLAVDDAGAGFASFRHILELRPRFVKLSREFILGIDRDPARRAMVGALAGFSVNRGGLLVAEGLESEAERSAVAALGVPLGQGYLLGRPAAPEVWVAGTVLTDASASGVESDPRGRATAPTT